MCAGYEYNDRGFAGGFDPMAGFGYDAGMGGGFIGGEDKKGSDKKVGVHVVSMIFVNICRHRGIDSL